MSNNQLIISDRDGDQLAIYGVLFAGASLIWFVSKMPLPGIAFLIAGLGLALFSSNLTITADRSTRILKLEYRNRLFYSAKEIAFDDIADIRVEKSRGGGRNHSPTYRVIAVLDDGKKVPFHSLFSTGTREKQQATKLHSFILGKTHDEPVDNGQSAS